MTRTGRDKAIRKQREADTDTDRQTQKERSGGIMNCIMSHEIDSLGWY